jgi:hypothetical protein
MGHLVYSDWSLDWVDMAKSPIWDSDTGFGVNGNRDSGRSVGHGHLSHRVARLRYVLMIVDCSGVFPAPYATGPNVVAVAATRSTTETFEIQPTLTCE